jgi:hypothetical protein
MHLYNKGSTVQCACTHLRRMRGNRSACSTLVIFCMVPTCYPLGTKRADQDSQQVGKLLGPGVNFGGKHEEFACVRDSMHVYKPRTASLHSVLWRKSHRKYKCEENKSYQQVLNQLVDAHKMSCYCNLFVFATKFSIAPKWFKFLPGYCLL